MKILLLGAFGNLGSEICRATSREIIPIGREQWAHFDPNQMKGIDLVVHAASDLRGSISESPADILDTEIMVTARVLELMRRYAVPRLMYVSSCAIYGSNDTEEALGPACPVTINGQLKLLNEQIIARFCGTHQIRHEIFRVFNTFGGRDRFSVVSKIIGAVQTGGLLRIFNEGMDVRDFIHVSDVAAILAGFMDRPPEYSCINVGTGIGTSVRELVEIAKSSDPELRVEFASEGGGVGRSIAVIERLRSRYPAYRFESAVKYVRETVRDCVLARESRETR